MKAINYSKDDAQNLRGIPFHTAMISISNNGEPRARFQFCASCSPRGAIYFTSFDDVNCSQGNQAQPITDLQAIDLLKFIHENRDKDFIVHCHAGVSRSAGICLFLHYAYGHELHPHFWAISEPRPYLVGKLLVEHHRLRSHNGAIYGLQSSKRP